MTLSRRDLLAGGCAVGAHFAFASSARAALREASVSFGPSAPIYAPTYVGLEKGYFKEAGLEMKMTATDGGARSRELVAAGQILFGHGDTSHPLQLSNRNKPSKILLATQMVSSTCEIVIRRDIFDQGVTTLEAFAKWRRPDGAKPIVAPTSIGSGGWMLGTYLFETRGSTNDINWVSGGNPRTMLAGLAAKQFDAIVAQPGWQIEAEREGFGRTIYDTRKPGVWDKDFGGPVPTLSLYALTETVEREPELTQAVVTSFYRAMKWIKETSEDEIYETVGRRYFGSADPTSTRAELTFDRDTSAYDGRISKADFERGAKIWYRTGSQIKPVPYEQVVDMRFLEAARGKIG
ncbi:ABC transporter substrate-binding protein [Bosea sp. (in: a-proteobacteria)]|jgi:NitT/TauT family transport system substrate-binding protein|uniref:ABC transporter substrate-binding protein n=1 Tax=Bosea sp. (in: a-proteobacteria) TaxID=1871050 RepID=UPI003F7283CD